jgi:hypothetical protein
MSPDEDALATPEEIQAFEASAHASDPLKRGKHKHMDRIRHHPLKRGKHRQPDPMDSGGVNLK